LMETEIAEIKTWFSETNENVLALHVIAEDLYMRAMFEETSIAYQFLTCSVSLYENDILDHVSDATLKANAYYILGLCYQNLEDYTKAIEAFTNSYASDPYFPHADYCLYAQGDCYQLLMQSKNISEIEARSVIVSVYSELVSKYPQSSYAPNANLWLQKNL